MQHPLGIGVIGAGSMARAYCGCLQRVEGARLAGVTGGRRAVGLGEEFGVPAVPDLAALLHQGDVAAVIIATPEMLHCEQTLAAAAARRHVLVEKPMAPTVGECEVMIEACLSARVKLMVVKQWRYRGVHVRAIEALRRNAYGRVLRIDNHTLCPRALSLLTVQSKPFYTDPAGGGLLMGWAVHNLDWVRHLAGSAPVTDSNARIFPGEAPIVDGEFEATIRFANGPAARVHVAIDVPEDPGRDHLFRTVVECERAELDLDGFGNFTVRTDAGETIEWTQPVFNPRDPSDRVRLQAYTAMLQDFVDAVRFDRAPPVSGEDGRAAVGLFRTARATS